MKTLNDLDSINLGVHPSLNIPLIGDFIGLYFVPKSKLLRIKILVKSQISSEYIQPKEIDFDCSNELMVNSYGLIDENGIMTEYAFFEYVAGVQPLEIYTLIYDKIVEAKIRGRFDI